MGTKGIIDRVKSIAAVLLGVIVIWVTAAEAHEMSPSVVDAEVSETELILTMIVQGEAMVAGVDLSAVANTNDSPMADAYDALRALDPIAFEGRFRATWPRLSKSFRLSVGDTALPAELVTVGTAEAMSDQLPRQTRLVVRAVLPDDGSDVTIGWAPEFGPMILRQIVEDLPEDEEAYSAFLGPGQVTPPLPRTGSVTLSWAESVANYIWLGFTHILPKGVDHILFVIGLFFFSTQARPLLAQVTTFTVAHTLTLALATLGLVSVPGSIVEPLIALSIAYIALENILRPRLTRTRLIVVFSFGLLHGLGFASVLGDIGLSTGHFISSLIAFNIGVEFGQIAILLLVFVLFGYWFRKKPWYRNIVVIPISAGIGVIGLWWAFERVIL